MRTYGAWTLATVIALGTAALCFSPTINASEDSEAQIRKLEDQFAAAVPTKNVDRIMANYVKSPKLVVFDVIPPRQYTGWDAYHKDWEGFLGGCKDAPKIDISDLQIEAGADYGFGSSIQHFTCTGANGPIDFTVRVSDGYRKLKGKWLIAHEHVSVPVDLSTAKADLNSKP